MVQWENNGQKAFQGEQQNCQIANVNWQIPKVLRRKTGTEVDSARMKDALNGQLQEQFRVRCK